MDSEPKNTQAQRLGQQLQRARLSRNQTQEHLAQETGLSVRAIRKLETGEPVTLETFLKAATHLGYMEDILMVLDRSAAMTIQEHQHTNLARQRRRAR